MKKIKKIIILLLLCCFVFVCQCPTTFNTLNTNEDHSHLFLDTYYADNNFGNVPVSRIAMLGSHDALTDGINYFSKADSTRAKVTNDNFVSNPFIFYLFRGAAIRLAKTQTENIYNQLKAGTRFIDVRITEIDGEFYNSHGFVADRLDTNVELILKFLDENKGEFIVFSILKYYGDTKSFDDLCDYISKIKYNNKSLFDYVNYDLNSKDYSEITYNDLTNNSKDGGVIFISGGYACDKYKDYFKLNDYVLNDNCKVVDYLKIDDVINKNAESLKSYDDRYLKINQTQITPTSSEIYKVVLNWSLISISDKHNSLVIKGNNYKKWLKSMPIYLSDNITNNKDNFNNIILKDIKELNLEVAKEAK